MRFPTGGACPLDYDLLGDKCYSLKREPRSFMEAIMACAEVGGWLAEPR